jgi:nucleoside-diphosphate-sugar epimerase
MNLLLIGGSGFLSGTMARCALRDGMQVWAVTRGKRTLPNGVHSIIADRSDRAAFAAAVAGAGVHWDLAVDCIAFTGDDAKQDLSALTGLADHLVLISTDSTIDPVDRPWRIDETYDRFDTLPYGRGKREAEVVLLNAVDGKLPFTILRPGHIYGPGSQLGCLPTHARDPQLIDRLKRGEPLRLVGGGHFLQSPTFAEDLWEMAKSCRGNAKASGQIYFAPGPDVIESREYYRLIGKVLGVGVSIVETSITEHLIANPTQRSFCCHRVYSTERAKAHGIALAKTPIAEGLRRHVEWVEESAKCKVQSAE